MAKLFFGDQCIFIRREAFERMGGYADMPLFEDWDLSRRMRGFGRTAVIETPVVTSGRRIDVWSKPKCLIIWWGLEHPLTLWEYRPSASVDTTRTCAMRDARISLAASLRPTAQESDILRLNSSPIRI